MNEYKGHQLSNIERAKEKAREQFLKVMSMREEILTAFIAKYGCEPDQVEIVEQRFKHETTWSVRKKPSLIESVN